MLRDILGSFFGECKQAGIDEMGPVGDGYFSIADIILYNVKQRSICLFSFKENQLLMVIEKPKGNYDGYTFHSLQEHFKQSPSSVYKVRQMDDPFDL